MERLLDDGVFVDAPDEEGSTALIYAAGNSKHEAVQVLLARGADATIRCRGVTALYHAARHEALDVVALLRKAGAEIELTEAAMIGDTRTVSMLLDRGADPNACDHSGDRALNFAVYYGYTDTVRLLLEAGAKVNVKNSMGISVLEEAIGGEHIEVEALLRSVGAIEGWVTVSTS